MFNLIFFVEKPVYQILVAENIFLCLGIWWGWLDLIGPVPFLFNN
jgi:hypothetical protein